MHKGGLACPRHHSSLKVQEYPVPDKMIFATSRYDITSLPSDKKHRDKLTKHPQVKDEIHVFST